MRWPDSSGISGRFQPEYLAGLKRNRWPVSTGIGGRLAPEYAGICAVVPIAIVIRGITDRGQRQLPTNDFEVFIWNVNGIGMIVIRILSVRPFGKSGIRSRWPFW
jgi:hypothetical protein